MVIALTPVAPGTVLAPFSLNIPRLVSELAPSVKGRERNININRARLQEMFLREHFGKYEFVLLLDSDVIVGPEALEAMMAAWKPGTTPCVMTKGKAGDHVCAACALIHRSDYAEVDYLANPYECQCMKLPNPFYIDYEGGTEA